HRLSESAAERNRRPRSGHDHVHQSRTVAQEGRHHRKHRRHQEVEFGRRSIMPATLSTVLVKNDCAAQHATDAGVRVVEVDVDTAAYDQGHVPAAAGWNWTTQLCDTVVRDIV